MTFSRRYLHLINVIQIFYPGKTLRSKSIQVSGEKMKEQGIDVLFVYSDEYHPGYSFYFTNFRTVNCIEESAHALFIPLEGEIQAFFIKEHLERFIQNIFR
jgi:hypothetical protein